MRSWARRILLAAVVVVVGCAASVARADLLPPLGLPIPPIATAPKAIGTLDKRHPVLTFSGGVANPTPLPLVNPPVPVVCEATCQEFTFTSATTRPFLVAVKDNAKSTNNGWDVYVYDPTGALVGAGNGIGANGQAVAVSPAARGTYTIAVTFTYAYDPGAAYTGEVRQMAGATWDRGRVSCGLVVSGVRGCFLLPVLIADPAFDLHVDGLPPVASTPLGFPIPVALPTGTSCYADETLQQQATRCLRFTSNIRNIGAGGLDIRLPWLAMTAAGPTSGFLPGQCNAEQAVHSTGGPVVMRPAGPCEFHPAHAHFHYKDLVGFSLHPLSANGSIGPRLGSGLKESFCLADDDYFGFGTRGPNGPQTYSGQPGCNLPGSVANNTVVVVEEGITPGWGDVYTWDTPGQFINISATPPGRYALVEKTNPSNNILVAGSAQRCAVTELTLTATDVTVTASRAAVPCPP